MPSSSVPSRPGRAAALAADAELRRIDVADALSLCLLIRDDDPLRFERAAVRWLSRYAAEDRQLRLVEARELVDMLDAVGWYDQVAKLRLERLPQSSRLRSRGRSCRLDVEIGGYVVTDAPSSRYRDPARPRLSTVIAPSVASAQSGITPTSVATLRSGGAAGGNGSAPGRSPSRSAPPASRPRLLVTPQRKQLTVSL